MPIPDLMLFPSGLPITRRVARRGHAGQPGNGPDGETCKTCAHLAHIDGYSRVYLKCGLSKANWTHGSATDIRAGDPACDYFEDAVEVEKLKAAFDAAPSYPGAEEG